MSVVAPVPKSWVHTEQLEASGECLELVSIRNSHRGKTWYADTEWVLWSHGLMCGCTWSIHAFWDWVCVGSGGAAALYKRTLLAGVHVHLPLQRVCNDSGCCFPQRPRPPVSSVTQAIEVCTMNTARHSTVEVPGSMSVSCGVWSPQPQRLLGNSAEQATAGRDAIALCLTDRPHPASLLLPQLNIIAKLISPVILSVQLFSLPCCSLCLYGVIGHLSPSRYFLLCIAVQLLCFIRRWSHVSPTLPSPWHSPHPFLFVFELWSFAYNVSQSNLLWPDIVWSPLSFTSMDTHVFLKVWEVSSLCFFK